MFFSNPTTMYTGKQKLKVLIKHMDSHIGYVIINNSHKIETNKQKPYLSITWWIKKMWYITVKYDGTIEGKEYHDIQ